jgi:hypothetical protein
MNNLSRGNALRIAALLSFAFGLYSFVTWIPLLMRGAEAVNLAMDTPPYFIVIMGFILAIVRIVGAYGTWIYQRWGIVLTLVTCAIDGVLAVPGILFAPTRQLQIEATIGVIATIAIIMLCLWRDTRSAES